MVFERWISTAIATARHGDKSAEMIVFEVRLGASLRLTAQVGEKESQRVSGSVLSSESSKRSIRLYSRWVSIHPVKMRVLARVGGGEVRNKERVSPVFIRISHTAHTYVGTWSTNTGVRRSLRRVVYLLIGFSFFRAQQGFACVLGTGRGVLASCAKKNEIQ